MLDGWMPWMSRKWIDKNKIEQTHTHIHTYIHVCGHMTYIWSFIWSFIYTHTYTSHASSSTWHVYIHVCTYVCINTYICMYVYMYTHTTRRFTYIHVTYMLHVTYTDDKFTQWRLKAQVLMCTCTTYILHTVLLPWGGICVRTVSPFNIYLTRTSPRDTINKLPIPYTTTIHTCMYVCSSCAMYIEIHVYDEQCLVIIVQK